METNYIVEGFLLTQQNFDWFLLGSFKKKKWEPCFLKDDFPSRLEISTSLMKETTRLPTRLAGVENVALSGRLRKEAR